MGSVLSTFFVSTTFIVFDKINVVGKVDVIDHTDRQVLANKARNFDKFNIFLKCFSRCRFKIISYGDGHVFCKEVGSVLSTFFVSTTFIVFDKINVVGKVDVIDHTDRQVLANKARNFDKFNIFLKCFSRCRFEIISYGDGHVLCKEVSVNEAYVATYIVGFYAI